MNPMRAGIWIAFTAVAAAGCFTTREFATFEELREASPNPLYVYAADGTTYKLTTYTVLDSVLKGSGTRIVKGKHSTFTGTLAYRDLIYVQSRKQGGYWRTATFAAAAGLTAYWFGNAAQDHGLAIFPKAGGSCPYAYVWDGDRFTLQGEAFGTSFGRALEAGTTIVLPAATARDGALAVRLTNERPETHYVNRVRLVAFPAPAGSTVLADVVGQAWPVTAPQSPMRSSPELSRKDANYWTSDLRETKRGRSYRDHLELSFSRPKDATAASVIVHAVNTDLVYSTHDLVFAYLGDESLSFLYQVENDPELVSTLKRWIEECSLTIEIWKDGRWARAGAIAPEASAVPFSRIIRIDAGAAAEDSTRLRLSTLAGGWMIDAVEVDWAPATALKPHPLRMRSAVNTEGAPVAGFVGEADSSYATMFPGERIELSFDAYHGGGDRWAAYALEVRGYLHEWPREHPRRPNLLPVSSVGPIPLLGASGFGADRVAVVNYLIREREAFLPLAYDHWKQKRTERAGLHGADPSKRTEARVSPARAHAK